MARSGDRHLFALRNAVKVGTLRRCGKADGARNFVEGFAAGPFHAEALVGETTQEDAALIGLKGKIVGPAEQLAALVVF